MILLSRRNVAIHPMRRRFVSSILDKDPILGVGHRGFANIVFRKMQAVLGLFIAFSILSSTSLSLLIRNSPAGMWIKVISIGVVRVT